MDNANTSDLDLFLNHNNIKYKKTYEEPHNYKENGYIRYYLPQTFDANKHYTIDIKNSGLVTFEYATESDNYVSTVLFEEFNEWQNINKCELFEIVIKHIILHSDSDFEYDDECDTE